ncbi:MAG: TetR/AcrR family transcriptional regulator [Clostridiales bacterium]|nr:TetR/AcrR family transcriptional regulator [Clostridiales bacterium]
MDKTAYFEQMRDRRKNEILAEAKTMFLSEGIAAFSMQQLAKNLDVSTVTLYKYFKNMDDIMRELAEQIIRMLAEKLYISHPEQTDNPTDVLTKQLRNSYNIIINQREDLSLLFLFQIHLRKGNEEDPIENAIDIYTEKWKDYLKDLLENMRSYGDLRKDLSLEDALSFIWQTNAALVQYIGMYSDKQYRKNEKLIRDHIERTIQASLLYLKPHS